MQLEQAQNQAEAYYKSSVKADSAYRDVFLELQAREAHDKGDFAQANYYLLTKVQRQRNALNAIQASPRYQKNHPPQRSPFTIYEDGYAENIAELRREKKDRWKPSWVIEEMT